MQILTHHFHCKHRTDQETLGDGNQWGFHFILTTKPGHPAVFSQISPFNGTLQPRAECTYLWWASCEKQQDILSAQKYGNGVSGSFSSAGTSCCGSLRHNQAPELNGMFYRRKAALILLIRDNYSSLDFILSWMLNEVNALEVTARNSSFLCGKQ